MDFVQCVNVVKIISTLALGYYCYRRINTVNNQDSDMEDFEISAQEIVGQSSPSNSSMKMSQKQSQTNQQSIFDKETYLSSNVSSNVSSNIKSCENEDIPKKKGSKLRKKKGISKKERDPRRRIRRSKRLQLKTPQPEFSQVVTIDN